MQPPATPPAEVGDSGTWGASPRDGARGPRSTGGAKGGAAPAGTERPSSVLLEPSTTHLTLGERMSLNFTIRFPEKYRFVRSTSAQFTDAFSIAEISLLSSRKRQGQNIQKWVMKIVPLDLGEHTLPPLEWKLKDKRGNEKTITGPPVKFQVDPPKTFKPGQSDILDIKPPSAPGVWPILVVLAAVLLAAAWWAARRRLRETRVAGQPGEPALPPHKAAGERLERLLNSGIWEKGQRSQFFEELSEIVRQYIQERFSIPAHYLTTSYLFKEMKTAEVDRKACSLTRETLERCDMVKFAKWIPGDGDKEGDVRAVRTAIDITKEEAPLKCKMKHPALAGVKRV